MFEKRYLWIDFSLLAIVAGFLALVLFGRELSWFVPLLSTVIVAAVVLAYVAELVITRPPKPTRMPTWPVLHAVVDLEEEDHLVNH